MIEFEAEMSGVLDLLRSLLKRQCINDPLFQASETELSHSSI
jgi:hypothetical protein